MCVHACVRVCACVVFMCVCLHHVCAEVAWNIWSEAYVLFHFIFLFSFRVNKIHTRPQLLSPFIMGFASTPKASSDGGGVLCFLHSAPAASALAFLLPTASGLKSFNF
eukprot:EG_transcript_24422